MRRNLIGLLVSVEILFSASLVLSAEVSQGKCIAYDQEKKLITLEEYDLQFSRENPYGRPTGVQSVYHAAKAEIGITPKPGDILRIAYDVKGAEKVAIRVMNVTQQNLMKK